MSWREDSVMPISVSKSRIGSSRPTKSRRLGRVRNLSARGRGRTSRGIGGPARSEGRSRTHLLAHSLAHLLARSLTHLLTHLHTSLSICVKSSRARGNPMACNMIHRPALEHGAGRALDSTGCALEFGIDSIGFGFVSAFGNHSPPGPLTH